MKSEIEAKQAVLTQPTRERSSLRKKLLTPMVCSVFASLGIFGGISTLFVGIVCVVIHGVLSQDRIFDRVGTVLLIAAIPMILVGSVFLDEINTKNN
jgi:hypothetical protein